MTEDRRHSPRHRATIPAQIETDTGRSTIAVTQDVSATGLLVLSHRPLEVGRDVTLHLLLDGNQHEITGTVVRHETLAAPEAVMWSSKAAVAIAASTDLARILSAISTAG